MYAGAAWIPASPWNADDETTEQLMANFCQAMLCEHLEPAAALRRAQLRMLRQNDRQSPYYRGVFILQGESHTKPAPLPPLAAQ